MSKKIKDKGKPVTMGQVKRLFGMLPFIDSLNIKDGHNVKLKISDENPDKIDIQYIEDLPESKKRKLDKKPGHKHRSQDIKRKYFELRKRNPKDSDLEIRNKVCVWYYELTGKTIDEGSIRHYLNEK